MTDETNLVKADKVVSALLNADDTQLSKSHGGKDITFEGNITMLPVPDDAKRIAIRQEVEAYLKDELAIRNAAVGLTLSDDARSRATTITVTVPVDALKELQPVIDSEKTFEHIQNSFQEVTDVSAPVQTSSEAPLGDDDVNARKILSSGTILEKSNIGDEVTIVNDIGVFNKEFENIEAIEAMRKSAQEYMNQALGAESATVSVSERPDNDMGDDAKRLQFYVSVDREDVQKLTPVMSDTLILSMQDAGLVEGTMQAGIPAPENTDVFRNDPPPPTDTRGPLADVGGRVPVAVKGQG